MRGKKIRPRGELGPGALIGGKAVRGKVTPSRTFEKIGKTSGQIAAFSSASSFSGSLQPGSNLEVNTCLPVSCGDLATGALISEETSKGALYPIHFS